MDDAWTRKMLSCETLHTVPGPAFATSLTASTKHEEPQTSYLVDEATNPMTVAGHSVIIQPTLHNST